MQTELNYTVPRMSCSACRATIAEEVQEVVGVEEIDVDLDSKRVTVRGAGLDDAVIRTAIDEAGYEAA